MGRRGPPPTPTNILKAQGSALANRTEHEPQPRIRIPTPPTWLSKEARGEWRRLGKELLELGLLSSLDRTVFALHCNAVADVAKHRKQIEAENLTEGPEVWAYNRAIKLAIQTAAEFGLTPSARRGLRVQLPPPRKDPRGRKRKRILRTA